MRIQLELDFKDGSRLPLNYAYPLSAWIYKTIHQSNSDFSEWLHDKGYTANGKRFKLFTFSNIRPQRFAIDKANGRFVLSEAPARLDLSFHIEKAAETFVVGLFKSQQFSVGDRYSRVEFGVKSLNVIDTPPFQPTMRYRFLRPVCISKNVEGKTHAQYLHPTEAPDYQDYFFNNLLNKTTAALQHELPGLQINYEPTIPLAFRLLSAIKRVPAQIKNERVIAYQYDFELTAPVKVHEVAYNAGVGIKSSALGLGFLGIL